MTDDRGIAPLLALLEDERRAILDGRFDRLEAIGAGKAQWLARLADAEPDAALLTRIGRIVSRNQRLLLAAMAGLRDGAQRLAGIRDGATGFRAYGRDGRQATISADARPGFERKA